MYTALHAEKASDKKNDTMDMEVKSETNPRSENNDEHVRSERRKKAALFSNRIKVAKSLSNVVQYFFKHVY